MNGHSRTMVSLAVISLFIFGGVLTATASRSADERPMVAANVPAPNEQAAAPANAWSPKTTDWPTFHDNNARTGLTAATATMKLAYYKWTAKTGGIVISSPAVATMKMYVNSSSDPKIFIGSADSRLYCINGFSGNIIWRYQAAGSIYSSPAVGDLSSDGTPKVVFGSQDGRIYCLDCSNGSLVWKYTTRGPVSSSPALADLNGDGKLEVAIGSEDNNFYVLDADGKVLWTASIKQSDRGISANAAIGDVNGDGRPEVVIQTTENNITCFAGANGTTLWNYTGLYNGMQAQNSPVIADLDSDGNIEVLAFGFSQASCLNGSTGAVKWNQPYPGMILSTPAIGDGDGDGKLEIFINDNDAVICIDGSDGTVKWAHSIVNPGSGITGGIASSPALADIDGDGKLEVIVGANDRMVHALNAEDGSIRWAYPIPKIAQSSPAVSDIDGDGKAEVVFGCNDARVYALDYNF